MEMGRRDVVPLHKVRPEAHRLRDTLLESLKRCVPGFGRAPGTGPAIGVHIEQETPLQSLTFVA